MSSTAEDELESSSSANLVPSKRDRKQTEKGKQFQVQLLEDERLSAQRSWRKQLNRVENYLADETEPGKLQSERIFLESTMEISSLGTRTTRRSAGRSCDKTCCAREIREDGTRTFRHVKAFESENHGSETRKGKRNVLSYSSIESKK